MPDNHTNPDRPSIIKKAWRDWLKMFLPLMAVVWFAMYWFGFNAIMPWLIVMIIVTLCYQRFVKKRSWRSIMWGVYASDK
ncbi:hypothetical protein PH5382_00030 [Phaeobacter sp. CECT 5382]|nr:hypothetical protein PH5382_00030 [Phaeobacter sp. CECT 5382]